MKEIKWEKNHHKNEYLCTIGRPANSTEVQSQNVCTFFWGILVFFMASYMMAYIEVSKTYFHTKLLYCYDN